jgi:hypothetical protein
MRSSGASTGWPAERQRRHRTGTGTSIPTARPSLAVILAALLALLASPGGAASAEEAQRGTAVLTYHRFDPTAFGPTEVTDSVFEEQLRFLVSHHVRVGYRAAFAISPHLVKPGEDMFALPRTVITEADRGARFAAIIEAACPEPNAAMLHLRSGPTPPVSAPFGLVTLKRTRDRLNRLD